MEIHLIYQQQAYKYIKYTIITLHKIVHKLQLTLRGTTGDYNKSFCKFRNYCDVFITANNATR